MGSVLPGLAPAPQGHPANPVLERLHFLYPQLIDLSLDRVRRLLAALGNPERRLPPVIHVAGTNGKGSTCAFLRAIAEQAGWRAHVTTSPHLVRVNERFRVAGRLVSDEALAEVLLHIERVNDGAAITVFEVLVAAGYLLFSRHPADICIIETGLGGRYDATNVIEAPAACAITSISFDHQDFLGDRLDRIAWEKAGIMKPGRPVVTGAQAPEAAAMLRRTASEVGAMLLERERDWEIAATAGGMRFSDAGGTLDLPRPALLGAHQIENAGLAIAALRASGLAVPTRAFDGVTRADWPARLHRLHGALAQSMPADFELWLDGGHNEGAGIILAEQMRAWADRPVHLVVGMKQGKNAAAFLYPLLGLAASVWAVSEPGQHLAVSVADIVAASGGVARVGPDVRGALAQISAARPGRVLICGSLYLAGEVLQADGTALV
jgi:dihydrofolate synthase/folylpolyglutamate synthase